MLLNSFSIRICLLGVLLLYAAPGMALGQIQLSPTRVMLTPRQRSQLIDVHNPTSMPVEVTANLDFKLLRSDSVGKLSLSSTAGPDERAKSCREWVKIFPRKFLLAPGATRSIRILVLPPDTISDGEYWGRLIFGSLPVARQPDGGDTSEVIRTDLSMRIDLDIPIIFRKGIVNTGIEFQGLSAKVHGSGTLALVDLRRLGNSAYRGTLTASLAAADGSGIAKLEDQFTTEFTLRKGFLFPKLSPGRYSLTLESVSVKKGGANDAVLPAPNVRREYDLVVTPSGILISSR